MVVGSIQWLTEALFITINVYFFFSAEMPKEWVGSGSVHDIGKLQCSFQVHEGQFPLGVGLPYKKGRGGGGCPSKILKRIPKRFQDPVS